MKNCRFLAHPHPKKKLRYTFISHIFQHPFISFHSYHVSEPKNLSPAVSSFVEWNSTSPPTLCFHITHRNLLFVRCFQELHIWPAKLIAACLVFFGDADLSIYSFAQKKRLSAKKTKGESSILQEKVTKKPKDQTSRKWKGETVRQIFSSWWLNHPSQKYSQNGNLPK